MGWGQSKEKKPKKGKKNRITKEDEALLELKLKLRKVRDYQKKIDRVMSREEEIIKQCMLEGKKQQALRALRLRKQQEEMLKRSEGMYDNLQNLVNDIEAAQLQRDVFEGLKQGTALLQQLQQEVTLEDVEMLMDETRDAIEYQNRIDEAMGTSLNAAEEAELEDELDAILQAQQAAAMPAVPATALPKAEGAGEVEAEPELS
uniref:Vacuolar protein sorting protein 20 n=1 Tax=Breviata anathema TaxID=81100 RepID=E9LD16_BREAA|nr:vacuolar protein sorting protein 20 [Breviata anathema]